ncbi:hypothetical protein Q8G71_36200, partial [Klebsiella pneumoniae]
MNKIDLFGEKILYSGRHLRLYQTDFKGTPHNLVTVFFCNYSHLTLTFTLHLHLFIWQTLLSK